MFQICIKYICNQFKINLYLESLLKEEEFTACLHEGMVILALVDWVKS
jgi:hypothetical protein